MSEKYSTPTTQSKPNMFDKLKSWVSKEQTKTMNTNLEIAATGQTPLKRAVEKMNGIAKNDSVASDKLNQELIDYRYEQARLERKRERDSKGQSFEEYVNEVVAQKELAKLKIEVAELAKPENQSEKPKKTNSISDRIKAVAALALLSGSMIIAPSALAEKKSTVDSKNPARTELARENKTQTQTKKSVSGYTSNKFKYTIPNVEASSIKTGTIVNEYHSNGIKFKGRFVMMPNGALFNLHGRTIKQTPKNIYAIENDRSGYFNLNDLKTKKVTTGQKISILNGEIVMVPDTAKGTKVAETKKPILTKPKSQSPIKTTNPNPKQSPEVIKKGKVENKAETPKVVSKQEKLPTSVTVNYLDSSTGKYKEMIVTEPSFVKQVASHSSDLRCEYESDKDCHNGNYYLNGQKYYATLYGKTNVINFNENIKEIKSLNPKKIKADEVYLVPFDSSKPQNIINLAPHDQISFPFLMKVNYWGSDIYFRPWGPSIEKVLNSIAKNEPITVTGILAEESFDTTNNDDNNFDLFGTPYGKIVTIKRGWTGNLEVHDVRKNIDHQF